MDMKELQKLIFKYIKENDKEWQKPGDNKDWFYPRADKRPHIHGNKQYVGTDSVSIIDQNRVKTSVQLTKIIESIEGYYKNNDYATKVIGLLEHIKKQTS